METNFVTPKKLSYVQNISYSDVSFNHVLKKR